jgi:hypothetical protein
MIVTPKTTEVSIWLSWGEVGLRFLFQRITVSTLDEVLAQDFERAAPAIREAERVVAEQFEASLAHLPLGMRERVLEGMRASQSGTQCVLPGFDGLPESVREAHLARDKTSYGVNDG